VQWKLLTLMAQSTVPKEQKERQKKNLDALKIIWPLLRITQSPPSMA
jgi:hypothetical protein